MRLSKLRILASLGSAFLTDAFVVHPTPLCVGTSTNRCHTQHLRAKDDEKGEEASAFDDAAFEDILRRIDEMEKGDLAGSSTGGTGSYDTKESVPLLDEETAAQISQAAATAVPSTIEAEFGMYATMIQELESDADVDALVKQIYKEMDVNASDTNLETLFQDLEESGSLGGTSGKELSELLAAKFKELNTADSASTKSPTGDADLAEISQGILQDEELRKEIEEIFDRGSAKLAESLEEIRKEQRDLAVLKAKEQSTTAEDSRFEQAESTMATILERVNSEAKAVEQAADDLRKAQADLDKDFIYKLQNGGLPKQAALAGIILFSFRSIADTFGALNDESLLQAAFLQGGLVLVCAAIFFLL